MFKKILFTFGIFFLSFANPLTAAEITWNKKNKSIFIFIRSYPMFKKILFTFGIFFLSFANPLTAAEITWKKNLKEGLEEAKKDKKLALIYFHSKL